MWAYGHHFQTQYGDDGHITQDFKLEVEFDQSSCSSHRDQHLIEEKLGYIRNIQEIMQVNLLSFKCVIFCFKWWDTLDWINVKEDHDSGIICINSKKMWVETKEPYVFTKHCNRVFFYPDVLDGD
jgi:hypothetical protein